MGKPAKVDFGGFAKYAFIASLLCGLFLCKSCAVCALDEYDRFQIGGNMADETTATGLVDESGEVKAGTKGSYGKSVGEGAGFFGTMKNACVSCTKTQSFNQPKPVYYAFWSLLLGGVVLVILDRVTRP